ncbi:MAG: hypothetical protein J5717_01475 [Lachnospiraceae bacterium]|nr:hypothetical protein [Lachnospiraceae bacterium]MBR5897515.1 hypothetical protein [Lachnospiraceae bacterium]
MYNYRMYGMRIVSDREIFQLLTEERALKLDASEGVQNSELPIVYIQKGVTDEMKMRDKDGAQWGIDSTDSWISNKTAWINVLNGERICYELKPEGVDSKLNSYLLGFGMALIALQKKILPIHSSGIMKGNNAILISGDSGAGKSSLTAAYIENGFDLMADDVTYIKKGEDDMPFAYPAFPYQKLCRNEVEKRHQGEEGLVYIGEEKDKFLVPWKGNYTAGSRPLKAIIFMSKYKGDELKIDELKGFEKYLVLGRSLFMLALLGDMVYQKDIGENVMWLASKVPVIGVLRPESADTLAQITEKTMEMVEKYLDKQTD